MDDLRQSLQDLFGHDDFRPGQREIIQSALDGVDTLAILPTGGGKSITYQLPAMLLPCVTLVLSPLIALMKDQVENLPEELKDRVALINSSLDASEVGKRLAQLKSGKLKIVYAAPERLRQPPFLFALREAGLSLLVIDEAHCISQWGHDFRPDYRAVGQAVAWLEPRSVLAVTATAPPDVQADIANQLGRKLEVFMRPTWRENLFLVSRKVKGEDEKLFATVEFCQTQDGAGLVYATSREKCEQIARMLTRQGIKAGFYHAGLPPEERAAAQDRFMSGDVRVMAATVAFGMGVDKSDIRFLLHYHPSRTLENYYQEAGRAGRDGKPSLCVLLHAPSDAASSTRRLNEDTLTVERVRQVYQAVRTSLGRRRCGGIAFDALTSACDGDEGLVRTALPLLEEVGLIARYGDLPRAFYTQSNLPSDPTQLAETLGVALPDIEFELLVRQQAEELTYRAAPRDLCLELLPPPAEAKTKLEQVILHRARGAQERAAAMLAYARDEVCRHQQIARYFGDRWPRRTCGACDVCEPLPKQRVRATPQKTHSAADELLAPLTIVADLARGYRPFALGATGLLRALRGTPDAPIKEGRSSGFAALASWKKSDVERLIEALIEQNFLSRDESDEYRRLSLTEKATEALEAGELDIEWRSPKAVAAETAETDADPTLLAALKAWRRDQAELASVPAYVIFPDKTLTALAARKPVNEFDLLAIPGIGPGKAAKYGESVLAVIKETGDRG